MLWHCAACTAAYAVGLPRCPQCGSVNREEDGMPKINRQGVATYETDAKRAPAADGAPVAAVEHPADGTMSPPVSNPPAPGAPAGEPVTDEPEAPAAEPAPPAPSPLKSPPRRTPPKSGT